VKPQKAYLTHDQADEVNALFKSIKKRLEIVKNKEEAVQIYNEAIVELNKYGVLGSLSIKQTQNIVTNRFQNFIESDLIDNILSKDMDTSAGINNSLCLITGQTTNIFFQAWSAAAILLSSIPLTLLFVFFYLLLRVGIFRIISTIVLTFLAEFGSFLGRLIDVTLMNKPLMFAVNIWISQSTGWIHTIGVKGVQNISGSFTGNLPSQGIIDEYFKAWVFGYTEPNEPIKAVKHFTGLRISLNQEEYESYYLGTALTVQVK
jgi:hypothetical protein